MSWEVRQGDCVELMRAMPDASVDAVCTDPPYGLEFMGKEWDRLAWDDGNATANNEAWREKQRDAPRKDGGWAAMQESRVPRYARTKDGDYSRPAARAMQEWHQAWASEALRVLKPGGHLLAAGGSRTYHRLTCAIEDAGFEIRDTIAWMYGSGFPKSSRVSRDPRFCQCGELARSDESTDPEQPLADHNDTAAAVPGGDPPLAGARHSMHTPSDSLGDCPPGRGSDGGLVPPVQVGDQAFPPPPIDAQGRSRLPVLGDGLVDELGHSPSPAPHSDHLANTDSPPAPVPLVESGTCSSNTPASQTGLGSESRAVRTRHTGEFPSAFPHCTECGRPNVDGFGTALKPAHEPIVVARKPLSGTVAQTVTEFGTGALNVDATRVGTDAVGWGGKGAGG